LKRIGAIFFIFVFLLITGRYLFFISFIELNKKTLKTNAIINHELKCIHISFEDLFKNTSSLEWKDHHTEIKLNNKMYDVVSLQKTSSDYCLIVVEDFKESNWLYCFEALNKQKNNLAKDLLNLLSQIGFYETLSYHGIHFLKPDNEKTKFTYINQLLSDYFFKLIKPPLH